jgi:hypothetical protein
VAGCRFGIQLISKDRSMKLSDPTLFRQQCYVNGQWRDASSGLNISVLNPATQSKLGIVPSLGKEEIVAAVDAAHLAQPAWAAKTAKERATLLRRWFDDFLRAWLTTTPAAMPAAVSEVMRQQLSPRDAESLLRLRMLDRGADVDSIRGSTSTDRVVTGDASNFRALLVPVRGSENAGLIGFDQSGGPVNALAILRNAPSDVLTIHGQVYEGSVFVKAMEFVVFH